MSDNTEQDQSLPFVTIKSKGGPHDDESYEAGYQMGQLDAILGIPHIQVYGMAMLTANVKQADLIAMHHGFQMEVISEADGVSNVEFSVACTCEEGHTLGD